MISAEHIEFESLIRAQSAEFAWISHWIVRGVLAGPTVTAKIGNTIMTVNNDDIHKDWIEAGIHPCLEPPSYLIV